MLVYEPTPVISAIPGLDALIRDLDLELVGISRHYPRGHIPVAWSRDTLARCFTHDFYGNPIKKPAKSKKVKKNVYEQNVDYPVLSGFRLEDL